MLRTRIVVLFCCITILFQFGCRALKTIEVNDNLKIIRLSPNVFIHVTYGDLETVRHYPANGLVYIHQGEALIVDTPWNDEESADLIEWLKSMNVAVSGIIPTHWHVDCMGGLKAMHEAGIPSYSHWLTQKNALARNLPVPQNTFQDSLHICLGDLEIICYYFGAGHTEDNIVVWIPEEKILFGGCMLKALGWKGLGYLGDANVEEWPKTLKKVLEAFPDARIVIPGHGDHGDVRIIHHTLGLLEEH